MNMQRMLVFMMACATAFTASAEEIHNGRFKGPGDQLGIPSGWFNDSPPWTIYISASRRT